MSTVPLPAPSRVPSAPDIRMLLVTWKLPVKAPFPKITSSPFWHADKTSTRAAAVAGRCSAALSPGDDRKLTARTIAEHGKRGFKLS